jgi:serine/threonine-protein kinase PRP4
LAPAPPPTVAASAIPAAQPVKSPSPEIDIEMEPPKEPDPAEVLAERARKRAAILAKYATSNPPTPSDSQRRTSILPESTLVSTPSTPGAGLADAVGDVRVATPSAPTSITNGNAEKAHSDRSEGEGTAFDPCDSFFPTCSVESPEPEAFDLHANEAAEAQEEGHKEVSAADYNPDADRAADDARQLKKQGGVVHGVVGVTATAEAVKHQEEDEAEEDDMFAVGTARDRPATDAKQEAKETGDAFVPVRIFRSKAPPFCH